jgi:hypothetical protein
VRRHTAKGVVVAGVRFVHDALHRALDNQEQGVGLITLKEHDLVAAIRVKCASLAEESAELGEKTNKKQENKLKENKHLNWASTDS